MSSKITNTRELIKLYREKALTTKKIMEKRKNPEAFEERLKKIDMQIQTIKEAHKINFARRRE